MMINRIILIRNRIILIMRTDLLILGMMIRHLVMNQGMTQEMTLQTRLIIRLTIQRLIILTVVWMVQRKIIMTMLSR